MRFSLFSKNEAEKDENPSKSFSLDINWGTIVTLLGIFSIALFVRTYFGLDLATQFGSPYLLSGGSDAYYYERIINFIQENHYHFNLEPLRKYPLGPVDNPRPPLYAWSVVLGGYVAYPFVGNLSQAVSYSFIFSTAIWGALTVFPVYLIGKEAFGKKAGIVGAFLLAVSSAHLQRSTLTNGDHDAMYLFFAVTAFYFFMKALKNTREDRLWVQDWSKVNKIKDGISEFFTKNKKSVLYSAMSGMAIATVALAWKGYAYVIVILLFYYLIQLFIDRFRGKDSLGITVCVAVTLFVAFLVALPWYAQWRPGIITEWFSGGLERYYQVPIVITLGVLGIGTYFTVTRDLPWVLVLSVLALAGVAFFTLGPDLLQSAASQYFIQNKLYSTIAEAQPPQFSQLVLSFGILTFFMAFVGIAFAIWHLIGDWTRAFTFILTWAAFSIYMATSAARFIFNSSPAFALAAGWVVAIIIDKADFSSIATRFRKFRGNYIRGLREGIKIKHILVILTVIFLIMMPNALYAVDAGIPYTEKQKYNDQIYNSLPDVMRPSNYNTSQQQNWYLGAFGYQMDSPKDYWPAAWDWFSKQDTDEPPRDRPAFLSWWDYGFECVKEGKHPTVADNFQQGYELAGNALMAQNESELIALLIGRQLQLPYRDKGAFEGKVRDILVEHIGEAKTEKLENIYENPGSFKDTVLANPEKYHPRAKDITNKNVMWAMVMGTLAPEGVDDLSSLYREVSEKSGYQRLKNRIGYIAVDSRLFPKSAQNTGIFYAPAKLAGYKIKQSGGMRSPIDFYQIKLVGSDNRQYDSRDEMPSNVRVVDYNLNLQPMFYNTTLYRVMAGYSGKDIGLDQGIPGLDQLGGRRSRRQYNPMPSWGMDHFTMDYRTAYYNPYKDYQNHSNAWRAISYDKAREYQNEGKGTVDPSARSYMNQGVVFLKYYDGAILKGTVKTNDSQPIPNAKVTVLDKEFTPHDIDRTDSKGRYEVKLPPGNNTIVVTNGGGGTKLLKTESINLARDNVIVTDEEAMRVKVDKNVDGIWDYNKKKDFKVETSNISGKVYIDADDSGSYNQANDTLVSTDVIIQNKTSGVKYTVDADNGTYDMDKMIPGKYSIKADTLGSEELTGITLEPGKDVEKDISISTATIKGNYTIDDEIDQKEFTLRLDNINNDRYREITFNADEEDNYTFNNVISGTYKLTVDNDDYCLKQGPITLDLGINSTVNQRISISKAYELTLTASYNDNRVSNQRISIYDKEGVGYSRTVKVDEDGKVTIKVPGLTYRIYAQYQKDSKNLVHMDTLTVAEDIDYEAEFETGYSVSGHVNFSGFKQDKFNLLFTNKDDPSKEVVVTSNSTGQFDIDLVKGSYSVYGWKKTTSEKKFSLNEIVVDSSGYLGVLANAGKLVEGKIYRDMDYDGEYDEGEGIKAKIEIMASGKSAVFDSLKDGSYSLVMPDSKTEIKVSKEGFSTVTKKYRPEKQFESNIALEADNVTVQGNLTFEDVYIDDITIDFEAVGKGAISKQIQADGDSYSTDLKPGKYNVVIDRLLYEGKTRYGLSKQIEITPEKDNIYMDLAPVYEYKVKGALKDVDNEDVTADISFVGPQEKEITETGEYTIYLKKGEYSIRAVNEEKGISEQTKLVVEESTSFNITLYDNIDINPVVVYNEEAKGDVPVTFKNVFSGYEITKISNQDGEINLALTPGEYKVIVDYETTEHVESIMRDVRYFYNEEYDISTPISPTIELNRELINATLTGDVKADGKYVDGVEIEFTSLISDKLDATVKTDEDGSYSLGLAEGPYTVYVSHRDGQFIYSYLNNFKMGSEKDTLDISLKDAVRINGEVTIGDEATSASLELDRKGVSKTYKISEDGNFETLLPKGEYELMAATTKETEYGPTEYKFEKSYSFTASRDLNIQLEMVKEYGIEIVNDVEKKSAKQGERVRYYVNIKNTGNTKDTFMLSSTIDWNIEYSDNNITLDPRETKNVVVNVHVDENATVDHPPVNLVIDSVNSDKSLEKELKLDVKQVYGVELKPEIANKKYSSGVITYTVNLNNTGNGVDQYSLNIINKNELSSLGWDTSITNQTDEIKAHGEKSIEISLTSNRESPNKAVKIEITATSVGDETVNDIEEYDVDMPQLSSIGSITMKGEEVNLEEEEFSLETWQWGLIVISVAAGGYYVLKKKRWI